MESIHDYLQHVPTLPTIHKVLGTFIFIHVCIFFFSTYVFVLKKIDAVIYKIIHFEMKCIRLGRKIIIIPILMMMFLYYFNNKKYE